MGRLKLGAVVWTLEDPESGIAPSWQRMKAAAVTAEQVGFDTVWVPDELQWENDDWAGTRGWWECVAVTSAIAEATSTIDIGTWVLSALHRNPGLTVRIAETIDEISGGRFVLGYGAGHAGRQGEAFGFPPDKTVGRYEEALTIVTDLLRTGSSTFSGEYHTTVRQTLTPRGPRPGAIPLVLGGHGPRTMRLAVTHADMWSAYTTGSSEPDAFAPLIERLVAICDTQSREPSTLDRSVGIYVRPPGTPAEVSDLGPSLGGSEDDILIALEQFAAIGATHVEFWLPGDIASGLERLAGVVEKAASI
jgi:alkanesulfonate monooxygenase SsuD/methylene tetrahydromethanopterin reductase-like flavin-dependent oxidoreductase (luciferase family)